MTLSKLRVFFILFFCNTIGQVLLFQCKDDKNQDVDWYILYKLPKLPYKPFQHYESNFTYQQNPLVEEGVAYMFMTENNRWTLSEKNISTEESMPGYTLAPIYNNQNEKNSLWFLYSNESPNEILNVYGGVGKGVVMVNETNGFWLIHSVPNFPAEPSYGEVSDRKKLGKKVLPEGRYAYPDLRVAEIFLCISLSNDEFNTIGKQLLFNEIWVYKKNLPKELILNWKFFDLVEAANEKRIDRNSTDAIKSTKHFFSTRGKEFISVARTARWSWHGPRYYDFYRFLALELQDNLDVKTWPINGTEYYSVCNGTYTIYSVNTIDFSNVCQFKFSMDRSKWAVTSSPATVCIGDVDSSENGRERAGGAVCIEDRNIWVDFKNIDYSQLMCNFAKYPKYGQF